MRQSEPRRRPEPLLEWSIPLTRRVCSVTVNVGQADNKWGHIMRLEDSEIRFEGDARLQPAEIGVRK